MVAVVVFKFSGNALPAPWAGVIFLGVKFEEI